MYNVMKTPSDVATEVCQAIFALFVFSVVVKCQVKLEWETANEMKIYVSSAQLE